MPRFIFQAAVTVSTYTEVDAATEAEALKVAKSRDVTIGGIGSGADASEHWIIDDADGEADDIRLEEVIETSEQD